FMAPDGRGELRRLFQPLFPAAVEQVVQALGFILRMRGYREQQEGNQQSLHETSTLISRASSSRTRIWISTCPSSNSSNSRLGHSISFTPGPASSSGIPISSHSRRFSDSR